MKTIIRNTQIVNEGNIITGDVMIGEERLLKIENQIAEKGNYIEINGEGKFLMPGIIRCILESPG